MCCLTSDLVICKFSKSMVIHDTEYPYWDQVSLNNINPTQPFATEKHTKKRIPDSCIFVWCPTMVPIRIWNNILKHYSLYALFQLYQWVCCLCWKWMDFALSRVTLSAASSLQSLVRLSVFKFNSKIQNCFYNAVADTTVTAVIHTGS